MSSEYKILQDNIDKIGAFKFTIRGWSVTIVIASCIGATTARLPSPFLLLGLVVFVVVFGVMEHVQTGHGNTFGRRCAEIERLIWRLLRERGLRVPGMVPRIAHDLADDNRAKLYRWKSPRFRRVIRVIKANGETAFYFVQVAVIVTLTIWRARNTPSRQALQAPSIGSGMSNPRSDATSTPNAKTKYPENQQNAQRRKTIQEKVH